MQTQYTFIVILLGLYDFGGVRRIAQVTPGGRALHGARLRAGGGGGGGADVHKVPEVIRLIRRPRSVSRPVSAR